MALAHVADQEWTEQIDVLSWVKRAVNTWERGETAIGGLVAISRRRWVKSLQFTYHSLTGSCRGITTSSISFAEIYPSLQASILSHTRRLRLNTLELLTSPVVERSSSFEVIRRCLQGEDVSLDVQGVRERVLRIDGVSQILKDGDDVGADICARWLIGSSPSP